MKSKETQQEQSSGEQKLGQAAHELRELAEWIGSEKRQDGNGEKKLGRSARELWELAAELRRGFRQSRAIMLASIETLLAGADLLSCDCVDALAQQRQILTDGMQSDDVKPGVPCESLESPKDVARDELLNYLLHNRTDAEQKTIYETVLADLRGGNGVLEFKEAG